MHEADRKYQLSGQKTANICGNNVIPIGDVSQQPQQVVQEPIAQPVQQIPIQIMVAIPSNGTNDVEFSRDLSTKITQRMLPPNTAMVFESRYGIAQSRESLVNVFLSNPNLTHILFLDSDILPIEMHGVSTLIQDTMVHQSRYIVTGIYYNSLYTGINAWINEVALKLTDPIIATSSDPVIPVDKIGMGYTLIRRDLFSVMNLEDRPLFYYKIHEGNVMESEDFTFFKKLKKYGIRPYIDIRVTAQHIKRCKVNPDGGIMF